jgi:hypothetical protein
MHIIGCWNCLWAGSIQDKIAAGYECYRALAGRCSEQFNMQCTKLRKLRYLLIILINFVVALLGACTPPEPLNSERIAQRYGNYGIDVLRSDNNRRLSRLYSTDDGRKTTRTLALVEFATAIHPKLIREHRRVLAGESIGTVFKESGWIIDKISSRYCKAQFDLASMPALSGMDIELPATLAVHSYVFHVQKGTLSIDYATITEIHHPDYLQPADLSTGYLADC